MMTLCPCQLKKDLKLGILCALPFQALLVHWHLDSYVGKLDAGISSKFWCFRYFLIRECLRNLFFTLTMLTGIKHAVSFNARQRSTELKERTKDDDHEELSGPKKLVEG